jgi:hypothetical protein
LFLTSALDGWKQSVSRPGRLNPGKRTEIPTGGWLDLTQPVCTLYRKGKYLKPRQILEARIEEKRGRGTPRKEWMDDIKETAGRRGKTIQEDRSMATTRKDPTLKGKRERKRRNHLVSAGTQTPNCSA